METGLRPSELIALEWPDIDFIEDKAHIWKAKTDAAEIAESPKTSASNRFVDLSVIAMAAVYKQKEITFLEGDAIGSINTQLASEYDIFVLPIPYHSNLSDHPDAVALGSLGEYLVKNLEKPLFLVPLLDSEIDDLFYKVIIVANEISDIIQNENYIHIISRNRSHIHFVFLYDEADIDHLASIDSSIDAESIKQKVYDQLDRFGKHTVERYEEQIASVQYSIFSKEFSDNITQLMTDSSSTLLAIIMPENKAGHGFYFFKK